MAAATVVLLSLGTWQVQRLQWKSDLIRKSEQALNLEPLELGAFEGDFRRLDYHPVRAEGRFHYNDAFAFGARAISGELGATWVVPFEMSTGDFLLVERGWLPEAVLPPNGPSALRTNDITTIEGIARFRGDASARLFTPDNEPDTYRYYWFDMSGIATTLGRSLLPITIAQTKPDPDGDLPVPMPVSVNLPNNHLGYAITWYGLAAGLIAVFFAFLRNDKTTK